MFKSRAVFPANEYCNVHFVNPVYEFKDSSGNSLFVLDEQGNLYINSTKVLLNQNSVSKPVHGFGLRVNSVFFAGFNNSLAELKGEILQKQEIPDTISSNEILFRNPVTKEPLAMLDSNGNLLIKGLVVYNGYYNGKPVDENAFNSNCTTEDGYLTVSGSDVFRDYYCNRHDCVYRDIDLDLSQSRCEAHGHYWDIGGNINATVCCEDDSGEYRITRQCNSGCTSDATDDACCNDSNDAVYNSECYAETSAICAPWDSHLIVNVSNNKWSFRDNCSKECVGSCKAYTTCSGGVCSGLTDVAIGENCTEGVGIVSGLCNTTYACSNSSGSMVYNDGGHFNCTATCDGSGSCDYAANCIDCSQPGDVNGCACACGSYGIPENTSNNNCDDGIDNDCDGKTDSDDPDCCVDEDGDGYGKYGSPGCSHPNEVDCDDAHSTVNPGHSEICNDGLDNDCDGKIDCADSDCTNACTRVFLNAATHKNCSTICASYGLTCISVGTDTQGRNCNKIYRQCYHWEGGYCYCYRWYVAASCSQQSMCSSIMYNNNYGINDRTRCGSHKVEWTYCLCRKYSGPAP